MTRLLVSRCTIAGLTPACVVDDFSTSGDIADTLAGALAGQTVTGYDPETFEQQRAPVRVAVHRLDLVAEADLPADIDQAGAERIASLIIDHPPESSATGADASARRS